MKRLAGKHCAHCRSQKLSLTADGQMMVVHCLDCGELSHLCVNPNCGGKMRKQSRYVRRCTKCQYSLSFYNKFNPDTPVQQMLLGGT